jgi:hypothetical protein
MRFSALRAFVAATLLNWPGREPRPQSGAGVLAASRDFMDIPACRFAAVRNDA